MTSGNVYTVTQMSNPFIANRTEEASRDQVIQNDHVHREWMLHFASALSSEKI